MNRRKRMLNDLDQDIRDHIEVETQENITRGKSPEEARYAALRKSGNGTRVKEETREVTGKREGLPTNRDLPDCWIRGSTILMTDAYAGPCFGSWIFQPRMRSQKYLPKERDEEELQMSIRIEVWLQTVDYPAQPVDDE